MKRISFATQLVLLWTLVAVICTLLAAIIWLFIQTDQSRQVSLSSQQSVTACERIAGSYALSTQLHTGAHNTELMHAVLDTVLIRYSHIEGGFWEAADDTSLARPPHQTDNTVQDSRPPAAGMADGFLAYSFPTYQGTGVKQDIPQAETPLILRALHAARTARVALSDSVPGVDETTVASACPVAGNTALYAWTLTRAQAPLGQYGQLLVVSLAVVLTGILIIALVLGMALRRWRRKLATIENGLSSDTALSLSELQPVGESDLDKIIRAVNGFAERSRASQARAFALNEQLKQAERFASLGKLAAQVAHDIRNPLGAVRLKLENVIAHGENTHSQSLASALVQVERIETQVSSLLALTQPVTLVRTAVDPVEWLKANIRTHQEQAKRKNLRFTVAFDGISTTDLESHSNPISFDPLQMSRALDNLILNAIRHAPSGGSVTVEASRVEVANAPVFRVCVVDNGPGVPIGEQERIFEPFVTGRPDGSGLGLSVAREVATAHGGRTYLADTDSGACFVIEIPWHTYS